MTSLKKSVGVMLAGLLFAITATAVQAATVVKVDLWDKGAGIEMPTNLGYGTPNLDLSKATMGIRAVPDKAGPGIVKFEVTNTSKGTIHEMIVVYLDDPTKPLVYDAKDFKLDEDHIGYKGEVSELDPGASGSVTLVLKPGKYLLACNVAGHFAAGMWTPFEVTR